MGILRLKQTEAALADGRLDEACELLADQELRSHSRGQELLGRLVRALAARGGEHLAAGRAAQAADDCRRAERLGGNMPPVAELKQRIADALAGRAAEGRLRGGRLAAARGHAAAGRLSVAERFLEDADDAASGAMLRAELAARREAAEAALAAAEQAERRGDWPAAIDAVVEARAHRAPNGALSERTAAVVGAAAAAARRELLSARPDRAEALLARLSPLASGSVDVESLSRAVEQCRRALRWVRRGRFRRATESLRLLQQMLPEARWVGEAIRQAEAAAGGAESLASGPLAMLETDEAPAGDAAELAGAVPVLAPIDDDEMPAARRGGAPASLPRRFLLQVDGAGSFLVLRAAGVTLGPVSGERRCDVPLMAAAHCPVVNIERQDGDYFLRAESPVAVNDQPATGRLLADGDRVAMGPRCVVKFRLPNAASATAVLELSSASLPDSDARRVVLLDRELVIGPGGTAHVRAAAAAERIVLRAGAGGLVGPDGRALPVGRPINVGGVGMVIVET